MYMDPFKGEDRYCNMRQVAGRQGKELQSILHCLDGVFGVCNETFRTGTGRFSGTVFWFPLRDSVSELSRTVYTEENMKDLLASFKVEAPSLLLFLNHIQRVQILTRDDSRGPEDVFSVGLAHSCLQSVKSQRQQFVEKIKSAGIALPQNELLCVTEVIMETCDNLTSMQDTRRWLVANYCCGKGHMSSDLQRLSSDPQLKYLPYVGVAIPLSNQSNFQSQVFCFLPLPLDTRSPTGLPSHVHGYFALEQHRRHLKWPPADQLYSGSQLDPPSLWNCLLVTELLPRVYGKAILR